MRRLNKFMDIFRVVAGNFLEMFSAYIGNEKASQPCRGEVTPNRKEISQ